MGKKMKLAEKTLGLFEYVKGIGGRVSIPEACEALDRNSRSINASVTDLAKKGLAVREPVMESNGDEEQKITYIVLTDEGNAFVQPTASED